MRKIYSVGVVVMFLAVVMAAAVGSCKGGVKNVYEEEQDSAGVNLIDSAEENSGDVTLECECDSDSLGTIGDGEEGI